MLPVEIGFEVNGVSGWGLYGMHLALGLARHGRRVHIGHIPIWEGIPTTLRPTLEAMQDPGDRSERRIRIDGSGNHFPQAPDVPNRLTVCLAVFEDSHLPEERAHCWSTFDHVIACSTWAQERLTGWGVQSDLVFQGSDDALFYPAPRRRPNDGTFYVFIGGKLEFRKGHDIAIAAFREFLNTPEGKEAVLVTAIENRWPSTMESIWASGYVKGVPVSRMGKLDVPAWLEANGIPRTHSLDLGHVKQAEFASIIRECDVGLFPNRCEGATNMVLPEVMMCGVPCIVSQNTGHLDSGPPEFVHGLFNQSPVTILCPIYKGYEGWGESSVTECVEALKAMRQHHGTLLSTVAKQGARWATDHFGWQNQAKKFHDLLLTYE